MYNGPGLPLDHDEGLEVCHSFLALSSFKQISVYSMLLYQCLMLLYIRKISTVLLKTIISEAHFQQHLQRGLAAMAGEI